MAVPTKTYDVLIVGGGHAGLSAALTLYRHLHSVVIFDGAKPRNAWPRPLHILPGFEGRQEEDLRAACRAELDATGLVTFAGREASDVERVPGDGGKGAEFIVTDDCGVARRGRKLLLASGKRHVFPDIAGYEENYPERIFHCMFTFGYENRNTAHAGLLAEGALGSPAHTLMVLGDSRKFTSRVTVYTNGDEALGEDLRGRVSGLKAVAVDCRPVRAIRRAGAGLQIEMDGQEEPYTEEIGFLVHQPATEVQSPLVEKLGLRCDARGDIVNVPPFYSTDVPGVFVAGDCAVPFKIIPAALFTGANAGAGVARSLASDAYERERAELCR